MTQPAHTLNPDELEVAEGREREQLEGWVPSLASDEEIHQAFEKAFDYRGDVTLTLKDGRQISGYVFDRRSGKTLADSAGEKIAILSQTCRVEAWRKVLAERRATNLRKIGTRELPSRF